MKEDPLTGAVTGRRARKSRAGCYTCKFRRVKCGEEQPQCRKCQSTGRKCEWGQQPPQPKSTSYKSVCSVELHLESLESLLCRDRQDSVARRSLHIFRHWAIHDISGHFENPLWDQFILRAVYHSRALWYLATALGAMHEKRQLCTADRGQQKTLDVTYPTQQYARGLVCLRDLISRPDQESIELSLLGALMCIYFEMLQDNPPKALTHLQGALEGLVPLLVDETALPAATSTGQTNIEGGLLHSFRRLDVQAACFMSSYTPAMLILEVPKQPMLCSMQHARQLLDGILLRCYSFLRSVADTYRYDICGSVPLSALLVAQELMDSLEAWRANFLALGLSRFGKADKVGACVLLILQIITYIKIATSLYTEESLYDRYEDLFHEAVSLGESVARDTYVDSPCNARISMDMGIQEAIFFAALKCRQHNVRTRAVNCLRSMTWQEGVWIPSVLARVGSWVINLEETNKLNKGEDSDPLVANRIPEFARVYSIGVFVDWGTLAVGLTTMRRLNGMDGEWSIDHVDI